LCWKRRSRPAPWARAVDDKIAGARAGAGGIPLGIKDMFATRIAHTAVLQRSSGNFVPPYESTVTSQLWRDGAVMGQAQQ